MHDFFAVDGQQLEPFFASPQAALVFSSQPDFESFVVFSVFAAGAGAFSCFCGVWAKANPAMSTTAENNITTFFMIFGFEG